jgi:hypothetical protein
LRHQKAHLNRIQKIGGWTLFFCLISSFAFAAAPKVGTITPSSGSILPNTNKTFTCTYSDADGWANIKEAYLLINTTYTVFTNTCYLYYDQNANLLYLRDDANTAWLGGYAPATSNTIQNSFVQVNCLSTTISGSTTTLTVNWNITFKSAYSGKAYNTYLKVVDDTGAYANWAKKGTYTVNTSPLVGTITPSSGTGAANTPATFTATFSDSEGWQNIQYVYFLMNTSASGISCPYLYYNQNTNLLYLRNDANTAWLGGYAPGSANAIENSYAKLDCAGTTVTGSGTTLTVSWNLITKSPFTGTKNIYLYVRDDANAYQNWTKKGTWTIPNSKPTPGIITPQDGASKPDNFVNIVSTYQDADTWLNIQYGYLLINTSTSGLNCAYLYYNQNTNKLYLRNDATTAWLGGYAPGSNYIIENSYVKLNCAATQVIGDGTTMTINFAVSFKPTFSGLKNCYLYVRDDANTYTTWTKKGTWTIDKTPPTGSILIENNSQYAYQTEVTLNLSATDDLSGVAAMQFSNDGITWSAPEAYTTTKTWALSSGNGEKTGYVKFIDKAGNESQIYTDSIILYAGILIDPASGGEVVSLDGKSRVIIPPGAIPSERGPTPISLIPLGITDLGDAAPEDYSIIIAVQCEPASLVFQVPVKLIFTLPQAEVPGTLVRLGRSETPDGPFQALSRTSPVNEDGYTLEFTLVSFSSYAGLTSMVSQGAPIGAGVKIPLPDLLTGAFGHSIGITVPPGRKGMQPNLNLQYRSSNPNSWIGMGWSLNPGYIVRSTKLGPPTYDDIKDTFIFVTDSGSTEMVHLIDNLYQAKIESSFAKFFKETDGSWKVVQKDGTTLLFGEDADSKEISGKGTFLWNLTKVIDNNRNYIELKYKKYPYDQNDKGKSYLSQIAYTGHDSLSPLNTLDFELEDRPDVSFNYISTSKIVTAKRLKQIVVKQDNELGNNLVWTYDLEYDKSTDTNRSLLKSITQKAADGKSFPTQTFSYQRAND